MPAHVLLVEVEGDTARLTPFSGVDDDGTLRPMTAQGPDGSVLAPPFLVRR